MDKQCILIVDDESMNIAILGDLLKSKYSILVAKSGEQALKVASANPPDLILLDIMMPDMDGFEVCEKFKENETLAKIPVLFISALDNSVEKVKGFQVGAFDYITKPFQPEEVLARVETHLKLYYFQRHLEDLVAERTKQLADAHEKLKDLGRVKSEFLHIISHEMRTPANGVLGLSDLVFDLSPDFENKANLDKAYRASRDRMLQMLDHSLMLCELEEENDCLKKTPGKVLVDICMASGMKLIKCDDSVIFLKLAGGEDVFKNLLHELAVISGGLTDEPAGIEIQSDGNSCNITISLQRSSSGLDIDGLFSHVADVHNASKIEALGLAPLVVQKIVDVIEGGISVDNNTSTISISLPLAPNES